MSEEFVSRPLVRWHGDKWRLAPWIIGHFPRHRVYVEPFGGGASVLLRKPRSYAEIYNDLDSDVVALFSVLRSPRAADFIEALRLTPFSREEFNAVYTPAHVDFERARRLVIRSFQGFGSDGHNAENGRTGFRANSNRSHTTPAHDWAHYPDCLALIVKRLRGIVIENRAALDVMKAHDGADTLHYVDPPYVPDTRSKLNGRGAPRHVYKHEMAVEDHLALLHGLRDLHGFVVLSGYPAALCDDALADWMRVECAALADGARPRVEVLWLNPDCARALTGRDLPLFREGAAA